jgi:hypothetical protein
MNIEPTPMHKLLLQHGYDSGYVIGEEILQVWEHQEDPPAPLVRPKTDEPATEEPVVDDLVEGEQP